MIVAKSSELNFLLFNIILIVFGSRRVILPVLQPSIGKENTLLG
jgi:hypothetical protein